MIFNRSHYEDMLVLRLHKRIDKAAWRAFWERYQPAHEEVVPRTSTKSAPWFVIPANHKWFRNLAVSAIVVQALEVLKLGDPPPGVDLARIQSEFHAAESAARRGRA